MTPSSRDSRRTDSGSPRRTATCSSGPRASRTTRTSTSKFANPMSPPMQVQGPKSKDLLRVLVGPQVANLEYYHFLEATIDGIPVIVTRTGWSAEVGFEIYLCDGSRGTELWNRVMEAGETHQLIRRAHVLNPVTFP